MPPFAAALSLRMPHSYGPENDLSAALKIAPRLRGCPRLAQRARAQRALLLSNSLMQHD